MAQHRAYREWLESLIGSPAPYAIAGDVLSSFVRIVTHPRIFNEPTPLDHALAFCATLRERPNAVALSPGERHWELFCELCVNANARGSLVTDAYLAALAIESGCSFATADRDFTRFPGLAFAEVPA
jgi:toxin-antitoxin system PIN domain toxin